MKITVYRRKVNDELRDPHAYLGDDRPTGDGWVVNAKAELLEAEIPHRLLMLGRSFLIYSMYHATDPLYLGYAVENFGAACRALGYTLPLSESDASWLTYGPDEMDAAAPADNQFLLNQIAVVFGTEAARRQAEALKIEWFTHENEE